MGDISHWLTEIKNGIYGKNVRNALYESIMHTHDDAQSTSLVVADLREDVDRLNDGGLEIKDEVIQAEIDDWLEEHPEATTTIPDDVKHAAKAACIPYRYENAPYGAWTFYTGGSNHGAQSLTTDDNDHLYIGSCIGDTTSTGCMVKIDLTTGQAINEVYNMPLGHTNGMAWCDGNIYVACAGGSNGRNGVAIVTPSLEVDDYIDFTNKTVTNPYGIASDGTRLWLLTGGNKLIEMSTDLSTVLNETTLENLKPTLQPWLPTRTGQTMFWYNHSLFVIMQYQANSASGYPWGLSYFAVYDEDTLAHIADVPCIGLGEFEDGCIYEDTLLTLVNTSGYGFVVRGGLKRDSSAFGWATLSDTSPGNVGTKGGVTTENIYIKINNSSTFFSNGTSQYPFKQWWHYIQYSLLKTQGSTQQLYIDGFIDSIVIRDCDFVLRIAGWGNGFTTNQMILDNTETVILENFTISPLDRNNHNGIMATHCTYLYARNIIISGTGARLIGATGTTIEFENLTASGTFGAMVSTDSTIRFSGTTDLSNLTIESAWYFPHSIAWPTSNLPSGMIFGENERAARLNGQAIDFGSTRFSADETFSCLENCTFTNGPDVNMTSCKFHCITMDGMNIFQLVRTDLSAVNLYLGVSARNGHCTWTKVI